jgi:hypothetical protein
MQSEHHDFFGVQTKEVKKLTLYCPFFADSKFMTTANFKNVFQNMEGSRLGCFDYKNCKEW